MKRKVLMWSTISLAAMLVVFGVFMIVNAFGIGKADTYSYVKVQNVVKYDDYLPIEVVDGKVVAYYGEMEDVAMTLPATYSLDEYNRVVPGEDYQITEIGEEVFKDVNFLYCKLMADNWVRVGRSAFENAQHIHIIGGENYQVCDYAFKNTTMVVREIITYGSDDPDYRAIGEDAFAYSGPFNLDYYSYLAKNDGYILVKNNDVNAATKTLYAHTETKTSTKFTVGGQGYCVVGGYRNNTTIQEVDMSGFTGQAIFNTKAFYGASNLITVKLGNGIYSIEESAVRECTKLSNFITGNAVVNSVGYAAFYGSTALTSLNLYISTFSTVSECAFASCSKLSTIYLPSTLSSIPSNAFTDTPISTVKYNYTGSGYTFVDGKLTITSMPSLSGNDRPEWINNGFAVLLFNVEFGSDVTSICQYCFESCLKLTNIVVPSVLASIGKYCFKDCSNLTGISALDVAEISEGAFYNCSSFDHLVWKNIDSNHSPLGTNICDYAFYGCSSLKFIDDVGVIWEGYDNTTGLFIDSIGKYAFYNCSSLQQLEIYYKVKSIGEYCFYNCSRVSDVFMHNLGGWPNNGGECNYGEWDIGNGSTIKIAGDTKVYDSNGKIIVTHYNSKTELISTYVGYKWTYKSSGKMSNGSQPPSDDGGCLTGDTLINLADGTTKQLKDITYNDELLVLDHDTGKVSTRKAIWIHKSGLVNGYRLVKFSDGTELKFIGLHAMFNADLLEYVDVQDTAKFHIGTHVVKLGENNQLSIVEVTSIEYIEEEVEYYEIISSETYNVFANGLLTSDGYTIPFQNMYEFNADYTYKSADRQAILDGTYTGYLFTEEYLNEVLKLSFNDIPGFRGREWGRLVELGYLPEEHIAYLIAHFLNSDEQRIM